MTSASKKMCILKCPGNVALHRFPRDEVSRKVWLTQLGLRRLPNASASVCHRHFSDKMRPPGKGVHLNPWAIPDINLPDVIELSGAEEDEYLEEESIDIPDDYANGYEMEETNDVIEITEDEESNDVEETNDIEEADILEEANNTKQNNIPQDAGNDEDMDFDVLLAKVHCISDLTKNSAKTSVSVGCDESDLEDFDHCYGAKNVSRMAMENKHMWNNNMLLAPKIPKNITSKFKRKLIASVKKRRILYDPAHPSFSNIQKKTQTWDRIGKILKLEGSVCRELWLNMRYDYQMHVRSLRQWLAGESNLRARPRIQMENELLFLWRFIPDKSHSEENDDEPPSTGTFIIPPSAFAEEFDSNNPLMVDYTQHSLDHAYANKPVDTFASKLIEAVKSYSELYDSMHPNYGDPKRKSIIWEGIANEMNDTTTKCLFTWIHILLKFEFDIVYKRHSFVVEKLSCIQKFILQNKKSPFKRMKPLSHKWHDPLESLKDQLILIKTVVATKKYRAFILNIDSAPSMCEHLVRPCWWKLARRLVYPPEQCEITWIVIQAMYTEVSQMRRHKCPLRDEWELESEITKLRTTILRSNRKLGQGFPSVEDDDLLVSETVQPNNDVTSPTDIDIPLDIPRKKPPPKPAPPPPPPPPPDNEITFTIPVRTEDGTPMQQIVQFKLSTPIDKLPDRSILDINTVLPNAHIVIMTEYKKPPSVYVYTLEKRKELIAEVMARPLVFNDPCRNTRLAKVHWGDISVLTDRPIDICMCFWDYIVQKKFFLDYDPSYRISEGTKWIPAPTPIFEKFQRYADIKNWGQHIDILPKFMEEISHFPLIYMDKKISPTWNRRQCHQRDASEIWSLLGRKFPVLENPKVLWERFKKLFLLYMSEMELSIYNPWPKFWAPVLAKMTFLIDLRYDPIEPIYHVLKEKFQEEIDEFHRDHPPPPAMNCTDKAKAIFRVLKENEYLDAFTWVNRGRFLAKLKTYPVLYNVSDPLFGDKETKQEAWQEMALAFHCTVTECHLIFQHLMKSYLLFRARDPNQVCRVNAKYWDDMNYIYACAVPDSANPKLLEGRTFRAALNGSTIKLAEEFQAEISLVDAKSRLALKNFAAAVNSLPVQIQSTLMHQIKTIIREHSRRQNEEIVVDV